MAVHPIGATPGYRAGNPDASAGVAAGAGLPWSCLTRGALGRWLYAKLALSRTTRMLLFAREGCRGLGVPRRHQHQIGSRRYRRMPALVAFDRAHLRGVPRGRSLSSYLADEGRVPYRPDPRAPPGAITGYRRPGRDIRPWVARCRGCGCPSQTCPISPRRTGAGTRARR